MGEHRPGDRRGEVVETRASLVDVLDRTLQTGVAVRAEIALCIADIDLVTVDLRAVLASTSSLRRPSPPRFADD